MYSLLEKYAPKLHKYFEMRKKMPKKCPKNAKKVTKSIKNDNFIVILTQIRGSIVRFSHLIKITISYNYVFLFVFLGDDNNLSMLISSVNTSGSKHHITRPTPNLSTSCLNVSIRNCIGGTLSSSFSSS